jgi:hypothetical protein
MILFLFFAMEQPEAPQCAIDQCDAETCLVETPHGFLGIPRESSHKEGDRIVCPSPEPSTAVAAYSGSQGTYDHR